MTIVSLKTSLVRLRAHLLTSHSYAQVPILDLEENVFNQYAKNVQGLHLLSRAIVCGILAMC